VRYGDWNKIRHCAELAEKVKDQEKNVDDLEKLLDVKPTLRSQILGVVFFIPMVILWVSFLSIKNIIRVLKHFGIIPKSAPTPVKSPATTEDAVRQAVHELLDVTVQRTKLRSLRQQYQQDCLEPEPQEALFKTKVTSAFWTTTPFQVLGAAQQLGRNLDDAAKSPMVAPIVGAATFAGLTVSAFFRLRKGFDTGGFSILAQHFKHAF
jgi:hypothetical protein